MASEGFISEADAAVLLAARDVLKKLEQAATDQCHRAERSIDAFGLGRFAETCKQARRTIFDALNVADTYMDDAVAGRAVRA